MSVNWIKEVPFVATVCDKEGIILEMNDASLKAFAEDGGEKLIGTNVLDCHPEPSRTQLADMLVTQEKNIYTVEKNGKKKMIAQLPWYSEGEYAGFVELHIELPEAMEEKVRE